MAKKSRSRKASERTRNTTEQNEIPPGATRKAFDRPVDPGGGPPGSAAGPRHASGDPGSDTETFEAVDSPWMPGSPPVEEEDLLETGPPFSGPSGGAVGGTPAQTRSAEGSPQQRSSLEESAANPAPPPPPARTPSPRESDREIIRLSGFDAIEYAEKQNLLLNKHPDRITGPRIDIGIAEARAIAEEDPDLIWLDVTSDDYYGAPPTSFEPDR